MDTNNVFDMITIAAKSAEFSMAAVIKTTTPSKIYPGDTAEYTWTFT